MNKNVLMYTTTFVQLFFSTAALELAIVVVMLLPLEDILYATLTRLIIIFFINFIYNLHSYPTLSHVFYTTTLFGINFNLSLPLTFVKMIVFYFIFFFFYIPSPHIHNICIMFWCVAQGFCIQRSTFLVYGCVGLL